MKKISLFLSLWLVSLPLWADNVLEPLLNKVTLQLQAESWVTTKTALVTIGVNASVSDQGIERIQTEVLQKLKQFSATADWHIVSFNRQQDSSGLERIQITAEARMMQQELGNMRDKAKTISKPGETFTVDNVQFTPSDDEIREANVVLRNNIYLQAKAEIDLLNKTYPEQKYYLHQIDFAMMQPPVPMAMAERNGNMMAMSKMASQAAPPMSVGNKNQMQATVVLAAVPDVLQQKLTHL